MIRLYDTMAREKRDFVPADRKRITMYVCGPTVYGRAHIGNARPAVVFDTLARLIRHEFGQDSLVYARNVTDVDDKIIAAAEAEGVGYRKITERYYRHYVEDMGALNVLPPDFEPRATGFIPQMISMIERLIALGHAYEADGHVLFSVPSDPDYGALSRRDRDAILAGARVEVAPYKRDPADFVLWKPAGEGAESVALSFDSPWGRGRPGWHIECSAMIEAFGSRQDAGHVETIDIHGGGLDLIFPHHENEIAQSRCAHGGAPLARYWVHNGFVDMGAEKMSKSVGNIVTVDQLLDGAVGGALRLALLSAHYRQPLSWTEDLVDRSKKSFERYCGIIHAAFASLADEEKAFQSLPPPRPQIIDALSDDLNTPQALTELHAFSREVQTAQAEGVSNAATLATRLISDAMLLGLDIRFEKSSAAQYAADLVFGQTVDAHIQARAEAKKRRDFAAADRIRDDLRADGIILEDKPDGTTTWRRE